MHLEEGPFSQDAARPPEGTVPGFREISAMSQDVGE
jgi:hypothetical protein